MFIRIHKQAPVGDRLPSYSFEPGDTHTGNRDWGDCKRCRLYHTRNRVVIKRFGGTGHTRILFIGEAPGELENKTGIPFVGTAGKILEQLFKLTHFQFQYCITNTVGCRPVNLYFLDSADDDRDDIVLSDYTEGEDYELMDWNREPTKAEMELCRPHIDELIENFHPNGVVYLGKVAESYADPKLILPEQRLTDPDAKLYKHTTHSIGYVYRHLPTLSLYHPAYIARLEYKLLTVKKEARKLDQFVERFLL